MTRLSETLDLLWYVQRFIFFFRMKPLAVAQVVFSLQPGGMENGVVNLANQLDRKEVAMTFLCLEESGEFAKRLSPNTCVQSLGRRPGWDWKACWRLGRRLSDLAPDIIHTHNLGPLIYAATARLLTPSLWRVPILHGEHGTLQGDSLSARRLNQRRALYNLCRKVHTVSDGLREELISLGLPSEKILSIRNGVDCDRFQPAANRLEARKKINFPEKIFILGAVGRFIATKRYPMLIEAFETLAEQQPDLHLMILGDGGSERDTVRERVNLSKHCSRIHLLGHQQEPAPFYQAMDMLVMPSSHEGLANAVLEAMASGVPVLAHAACGASEVITDGLNGFLGQIKSSQELAVQIKDLRSRPDLLVQASKNARESAQKEFSLQTMTQAYLQVFQHLA
ncbi:MAG: glycosyltransferase [Verrucomicrobia bacterium]|nr:glycosyltransferase [Verrucomicrobiota bacterium]